MSKRKKTTKKKSSARKQAPATPKAATSAPVEEQPPRYSLGDVEKYFDLARAWKPKGWEGVYGSDEYGDYEKVVSTIAKRDVHSIQKNSIDGGAAGTYVNNPAERRGKAVIKSLEKIIEDEVHSQLTKLFTYNGGLSGGKESTARAEKAWRDATDAERQAVVDALNYIDKEAQGYAQDGVGEKQTNRQKKITVSIREYVEKNVKYELQPLPNLLTTNFGPFEEYEKSMGEELHLMRMKIKSITDLLIGTCAQK